MKHKVSELEGALLDAAVAKALGLSIMMSPTRGILIQEDAMALTPHMIWVESRHSLLLGEYRGDHPWAPSSNWAQGGPIIEREGIELHCIDRNGRLMQGEWMARASKKPLPLCFGPTPLIAAMRAFVDSKFGEEVEL